MSASATCPHPDLHYHLNHAHFADSNVHILEITATCRVCDAPMVFIGKLPVGSSLAAPAISADGLELQLPMVGQGEVADAQTSAFLRIDGSLRS